MIARLQEFFALLRKNGVPVSSAEVLDGLRALEIIGLDDPIAARDALGATLTKRDQHRAIFDELFGLFFLRRGEIAAGDDLPIVETLRQRGFTEEEIEALLAVLADEAARLNPTARAGLGLRSGSIESLMRITGSQVDFSRLQNPLQVGYFSQQLATQLQFREAETQIQQLRERLERNLGPERAQLMAILLGQHLGDLRQAVRRFVEDEFRRQNVAWLERRRAETLAEKPFAAMTEDELRKLTVEVERLGRKLRQMATLRPRVGRLGRLDARRTIRRSLRSGGVPFELKRKRRRIEKPRLVVLCDISDSVRHVSRFMLQFAYTLQDQFSAVRSFVFVSDIAEITSLFREHDIQSAVEEAYRGAVVNVFANSNYGRALVAFRRNSLDAVTSKTTVIVIGDGRNNYNPHESWALGDIRARARRVLWLNPEPPPSWAFGDSAMLEYQKHCDRVAVVHNLATLTEVTREIVL